MMLIKRQVICIDVGARNSTNDRFYFPSRDIIITYIMDFLGKHKMRKVSMINLIRDGFRTVDARNHTAVC